MIMIMVIVMMILIIMMKIMSHFNYDEDYQKKGSLIWNDNYISYYNDYRDSNDNTTSRMLCIYIYIYIYI